MPKYKYKKNPKKHNIQAPPVRHYTPNSISTILCQGFIKYDKIPHFICCVLTNA